MNLPNGRAIRISVALLAFILPGTCCLSAGQTDYVLCGDPASEKAHNLREFGSRIERCGGNIGLRSEFYLCRTTPAIIPEPKNLALNLARKGYPRPIASSTCPQYDIWGPLDGADGTWTNHYTDEKESTWDLDFGRPTRIGKVVIKTWASYPLRDFDLLRWDGSRWDTRHPVAVIRGNKGPLITLAGLDITTSRLRMRCINGPKHQAIYRRIQEFEVYAPPSTPPPFKPREFSYQVRVPSSGVWTLEVQEMNDDSRNGDRTLYRVLVDGKSVHLRDYVDDGPGLITYFVDVPATGKTRAVITFRDTSGYGVRIRSLRIYSDFMEYCRQNRFMVPMVICPRYPRLLAHLESDTREIDRWIEVFANAGARDSIGFAFDFPYLQQGPEHMQRLADAIGKLILEKNVPFVPGYPTTWSFSPLNTPDGKGKTFGAIEYQQIAYSKYDNYHDPGLKEYMDSCKPGWYDVHYGLTIPNHWSSVPWLTMNNPWLNEARRNGITDAVRKLNPWLMRMERNGITGLIGLIGEDEPVYWTKIVDVFEDGYGRVNNGVPRTDMLVDFNWYVIQDAAKDGVNLDPADGLDEKEKRWLHLNPARFNRMISNTIRSAIRKEAIVVRGERIEFPKDDRAACNYVYWVGGRGYPLEDRYHPIWEQAVYPEAGVGLGGDPRPYLRARELGRVACSDYESHNETNLYKYIPNLCGLYENGCRFSHHTNPSDPENWKPVARMLANPTPEMIRRRMGSLLITWRRDAINLMEEMKGTGRPDLLRNAQRLLDEGRYRDAYEEALKAKSIALPANYRVEGSGDLWPYDISVIGTCVEVTVRGMGDRFVVDTTSEEACVLVARGLPVSARLLLRQAGGTGETAFVADSSGSIRVAVPPGDCTLEVRE